MKESKRERIKMRATYINGIAIAVFAVGGLGVYVSLFREGEHLSALVVIVVVLLMSQAFHRLGLSILRELDDE